MSDIGALRDAHILALRLLESALDAPPEGLTDQELAVVRSRRAAEVLRTASALANAIHKPTPRNTL